MNKVQFINDGGEIVTASLVPQTKLFKADRLIDHQCISKLATLKPLELKILMIMWEKCNKFNFVADNVCKDTGYRKNVALSIKSLIKNDWIKKAEMLAGKQTWRSGFMINPFYFRKSKSYDDYKAMTDNYNFGVEAQVVMSFSDMVKQQEEDVTGEIHSAQIVQPVNTSPIKKIGIRIGGGLVFQCRVADNHQ